MSGFTHTEQLSERPEAPVMVIHCRSDITDDWHASHIEAAQEAFPTYVVIGMQGHEGDAMLLSDRDVVFWPWMGATYAFNDVYRFARVVARTTKRTRMLKDAKIGPDGLNGYDPIAWAKEHVTPEVDAALDHEVADLSEIWFTPEPERPPLVSDYPLADIGILEDMPEPLDVFTRAALPTLHKRQLPAAIADYVFDQSEIIGSDPCVLALASLVATASLIHDDIKLQPKAHEYGWTESARLWGVVVGDPSTKKTPPMAKAVSHVKKIDIDLAQSSAAESEAYRVEMKIHAQIEKAHVEGRARNGSLGHSDLAPAPKRPPERRALIEDITIEKCAEVMADNPGGILALHDELSGWFGAMDAYRAQGNKDAAFWLRCYNGGSMRVDRKTAGSSILVPNVSACLLGGIQPEPMRAQASKMKDDGLLQRFMIVCAQPADPFGVDRPANREAVDDYRRVQDILAKAKGDPANPLMFSDDARKVFWAAMQRAAAIEREIDASPRLVAHAGKLSGLFVRLGLTYHAMDCAYAGTPITHLVDESTDRAVESFIFDFLMGHVRHFYDTVLGVSPVGNHVRWIAGHILGRHKERFTNTDIMRAYRAWEAMEDSQRRAVLGYLEAAEWISPDGRRTPGQPVKAWLVNPRVHDVFKEQAEDEQKRIEAGRKAVIVNTR
jgi:hypothetical protein